MPNWLIITIGVATPLLAFAGAFIGHLLTRRSAKEQLRTARHAETLLMIRWASEQIDSGGEASERAVVLLRALGDTDLVDDTSQHMIDAALMQGVEALSAEEYTETQLEGVRHDDDSEA